MKDRQKQKIIKKIIAKGGMMAMVAEYCMNDENMSDQFLIECYEDCDIESGFRKFWGKELVNDIIMYNVNYNAKPLIDFM